MESWKGLKKVTENRKNQKISVENQNKHLCRKPENAIFKSQKPGKIEKYGRNFFEICGNRKSPFGSCGKPVKPKKTMKSWGNRKIRKKPWKAGNARYFLWKSGNRPFITPPLMASDILKSFSATMNWWAKNWTK